MIIGEHPDPWPITEASATRRAASSASLMMHAVRRANWLLAARQNAFFICCFKNSHSSNPVNIPVYHNASANCEKVLVVAVLEEAPKVPVGNGYISVESDSGSGGADTAQFILDEATPRFRFNTPKWILWTAILDIDNPGEQYHNVSIKDLDVHSIMMCEIPRGLLDPSVDTAVAEIGSDTYTGLVQGRSITDDATAGISDVLAAIDSAKDNNLRFAVNHILGEGDEWSATSSGTWGTIGATETAMTTFGWRHKARCLKSGDTTRTYDIRICARYSGTGTGQLRFRSSQTGDTVTFSSLTSSYAHHSSGASTLQISCDAVDDIYPEVYTTDGTTTVDIRSVAIYEHK